MDSSLSIDNVRLQEEEFSGSFDLEGSSEHATILLIVVKRQTSVLKSIGFVVCNLLDCSLRVAEISDNEFFTLMESIILQVGPKACILYTEKDPIDIKRIKHILSICNVSCVKHSFTSNQDTVDNAVEVKIIKSLEFLLGKNDSIRNHVKILSLRLGMQSLLYLFNALDFLSYEDYRNKFTLSDYTVNSYLSMDRAAFASLSILPQGHTSMTDSTTLFGLLNKCRTVIGTRRLRMWISQPLTGVEDIKKRHDCVDVLKSNLYRLVQAECLRKVPDLDAIVIKFRSFESSQKPGNKGRNLPTFEDLVRLYDCIIAVNRMVQFVLIPYDGKHCDTIKSMFTDPLLNISSMFETYLRLVETSVDLKEAEKRNYVINRNFDAKLKTIAANLDNIRNDIEELRTTIEQELFFTNGKKKNNSIKISECNSMGFLFRVSKRDHAIIQTCDSKIAIEKVRLNKNEFLFTTPKLRNLCLKFSMASSEYEKTQASLVNKVFKVASTYWVLVERLSNIIATLDILAGFAEVSATLNYVRPTLDLDNKEIRLIAARHPLVECGFYARTFVPNDLIMERNASRICITTGPNMGGKSTYIRQAGLIVVMNQIGCFVPCTSAKLPIFEHILCRVGASDIQLRGVSTFLAEMVEAAAILKTANEHSLAIIDELGRGTSTCDGFGLAWGIVVDLIKRAKCFCLCATHFHEMGSLADEYDGVVNRHLSAKFLGGNEGMAFLYEIKDGICRDSYAINVAEIANFPPKVISNAQEKLNELESLAECGQYASLRRLLASESFEEFYRGIPTLLEYT